MSFSSSPSVARAADTEAKIAQTITEIDWTKSALADIAERSDCEEQRLFFLLNADTAREDFFEIRSEKAGEIRRIIINSDAEIIFDSENKVTTVDNHRLPDFDEIDEKFSHVIPDDGEGRNYYRKLRGLHIYPPISHDLPRDVRSQLKKAQKEAAKDEARQLRQTIVDNFRQQDCVERQREVDEIIARREEREQQVVELHAQQESLQQTLIDLQKQVAEAQLKRRLVEEAKHEADRKREHDSKRLAWLDRFSPPARSQAVPMDASNDGGAKDERDKDEDVQSQASTKYDEQELDANNGDEICSLLDSDSKALLHQGIY